MNVPFEMRSPENLHGRFTDGVKRTPQQRRTIMKKFTAVSILALTLVSGGAAFAQTTPPAAPSTAPAVTAPVAPPAAVKPAMPSAATPSSMTPAAAPAVTMDPAFEAKFKAADKDGKGFIEGAALEAYKPVMTQVDTNKDGKISRAEFAAAAKAGIIK